MTRALLLAAAAFFALPAHAQPGAVQGEPQLCRPGAAEPALLLQITGLKDRAGSLRVELYPDRDPEFLGDKNKILESGQVFRRIIFDVPPGPGPTLACLGIPRPGRYSLAVIHDRQNTRHFSPFIDGIGFPGDPRLSYSKPPASKAWITIAPGLNRARLTIQYLHGLFQVGPVRHPVDGDAG